MPTVYLLYMYTLIKFILFIWYLFIWYFNLFYILYDGIHTEEPLNIQSSVRSIIYYYKQLFQFNLIKPSLLCSFS